MVNMEGFTFNVEVVYEWLPIFCSHCQIIMHHVSTCSWLHPQKDNKVDTCKKKVPSQKDEKCGQS